MSISVFQPKGRRHIQYIHDKAKEIFLTLYQGNEAHWIDALTQAMREHRNYLIATQCNQQQPFNSKSRFERGTFWFENGIWRKI